MHVQRNIMMRISASIASTTVNTLSHRIVAFIDEQQSASSNSINVDGKSSCSKCVGAKFRLGWTAELMAEAQKTTVASCCCRCHRRWAPINTMCSSGFRSERILCSDESNRNSTFPTELKKDKIEKNTTWSSVLVR